MSEWVALGNMFPRVFIAASSKAIQIMIINVVFHTLQLMHLKAVKNKRLEMFHRVKPQITVSVCTWRDSDRRPASITSPAAAPGCWCSSRWPAGRSRRWKGCTSGSLHSTPCSRPYACDPVRTFKRVVSEEAAGKHSCMSAVVGPYHSVASWKSGQPHSAHVKQPDLSIVVWQCDDPLVGRDAYPETFESDCKRDRLYTTLWVSSWQKLEL